jgi:predicted CXXCH cytochrome family protein
VETLFDDPPSARPEAPPPVVEAAAAPVAPVRPRPRWQGSTHGPYAARLCQACHLERGEGFSGVAAVARLRHSPEILCRRCHRGTLLGEVADANPALHGPVAAGLCLACHFPHRSREPFLLRSPRERICGGCHRSATLLGDHPAAPEGKCLECHDPHAPLPGSAS